MARAFLDGVFGVFRGSRGNFEVENGQDVKSVGVDETDLGEGSVIGADGSVVRRSWLAFYMGVGDV